MRNSYKARIYLQAQEHHSPIASTSRQSITSRQSERPPIISRPNGVWLSLVCYRVLDRRDYEFRFPFLTTRPDSTPPDLTNSHSLEHLERIVNGFEGEGGALAYIHDDHEVIRNIANHIVKYGRSSVLFTYVPDYLDESKNYYIMGKNYPNPDKGDYQ